MNKTNWCKKQAKGFPYSINYSEGSCYKKGFEPLSRKELGKLYLKVLGMVGRSMRYGY